MTEIVERLPFKLARPNADTPVTEAENIGYGNTNIKEVVDGTIIKMEAFSIPASSSDWVDGANYFNPSTNLIRRYEGGSWSTWGTPTTKGLYSLNGVLYKWNGTAFVLSDKDSFDNIDASITSANNNIEDNSLSIEDINASLNYQEHYISMEYGYYDNQGTPVPNTATVKRIRCKDFISISANPSISCGFANVGKRFYDSSKSYIGSSYSSSAAYFKFFLYDIQGLTDLTMAFFKGKTISLNNVSYYLLPFKQSAKEEDVEDLQQFADTVDEELHTKDTQLELVDGYANGLFDIPDSGIRANSASADFGQQISQSGSSFKSCGYIPYATGTDVKIKYSSGFGSFGIVFYDANKQPLTGKVFAGADAGTEITASDANAVYFRSSAPSGNGYFKYYKDVGLDRVHKIDYCYEHINDNDSQSKWAGKTILVCGTSIPGGAGGDATGYPRALGKLLNCTIINRAIGSSVIRKSKRNGSAMNDTNQKRAFSQTKAEKEAMYGESTYNALSYEELLLPYLNGTHSFPDLIILDYSSDGGADEGYNDPLLAAINEDASDKNSLGTDTLARELNMNRCTMTGAMNFIIDLIYQYNPQAKIMLMGFQNRQMRPYAMEGQKNVADYWQIPYFPLSDVLGWSQKVLYGSMSKFNTKYASLISGGTITAATEDVSAMRYWCPDGIHPHSNTTMINPIGERESNLEIAKKVAAFLETIY